MKKISENNAANSILLVEDEPGTLELLQAILTIKFPDIALYTAENGRAGLELFKRHSQDIVITDINMPEMSGMQMIDNIRTIKADTRIIVLTGNSGKNNQQDLEEKELIFNHLIVKPVVFQELFIAIEQCLGEVADN